MTGIDSSVAFPGPLTLQEKSGSFLGKRSDIDSRQRQPDEYYAGQKAFAGGVRGLSWQAVAAGAICQLN